jgi:hypothetical protein
MSKEAHQSFFNDWIEKLSSVKEQFIIFPSDDELLQLVCDKYTVLLLQLFSALIQNPQCTTNQCNIIS